MEKEKTNIHPTGLPPHSNRLPPHPSPPSAPFVKREIPPPSPSLPEIQMMEQSLSNSHFSQDISSMPDFPPRKLGHRRAHSDIVCLPDDISFDNDLGFVGADCPTLSDDAEDDIFSMYMDMEKLASSSSAISGLPLGEMPSATAMNNSLDSAGMGERPRIRHQHSQSIDGSISIKPEMLASSEPTSLETKKAMSAAKLADLALVDPKRAKRIWANRQSAARSKERKMRYIAELERKVQTLQTEATTLSAQLTMLQRDTNGLTAENSQLKLRLQSMEQQVHLQDALNEALREEVQRLKVATGQVMPNGGQVMNFGSSFGANQQFYPNPNAHSFVPVHQFQQLQIQQQHQPPQQQKMTELRSKTGLPSSKEKESAPSFNSTSSEKGS